MSTSAAGEATGDASHAKKRKAEDGSKTEEVSKTEEGHKDKEAATTATATKPAVGWAVLLKGDWGSKLVSFRTYRGAMYGCIALWINQRAEDEASTYEGVDDHVMGEGMEYEIERLETKTTVNPDLIAVVISALTDDDGKYSHAKALEVTPRMIYDEVGRLSRYSRISEADILLFLERAECDFVVEVLKCHQQYDI